jgi:hypothetical protein
MRLFPIPGELEMFLGRMVLGGSVLVLTGLFSTLVGVLKRHALARSGGLMIVLAGYFVIFTDLMWSDGRTTPVASTVALLSSVLVFRLMAAFEPATPASTSGSSPEARPKS